jgi:hypothetical protein
VIDVSNNGDISCPFQELLNVRGELGDFAEGGVGSTEEGMSKRGGKKGVP